MPILSQPIWCPSCGYRGRSKLRLTGKIYLVMPFLIILILLALIAPISLPILGALIVFLVLSRVNTCPTCGFEEVVLDEQLNSEGRQEDAAHEEREKAHRESSDRREKSERPSDIDSAFEVLEVGRGASKSEIRAAYRKIISQYHPDKVAGLGVKLKKVATEEAQKINVAYKLLKEAGFA